MSDTKVVLASSGINRVYTAKKLFGNDGLHLKMTLSKSLDDTLTGGKPSAK